MSLVDIIVCFSVYVCVCVCFREGVSDDKGNRKYNIYVYKQTTAAAFTQNIINCLCSAVLNISNKICFIGSFKPCFVLKSSVRPVGLASL